MVVSFFALDAGTCGQVRSEQYGERQLLVVAAHLVARKYVLFNFYWRTFFDLMDEETGTIGIKSFHSLLDNISDDTKNFETSVETSFDSEEIYFGYGEEQFGRSQFSARGRVSSIKSENEFFDTVIHACCTDENGQISAEKMLEVLMLNFSTGLEENKLFEMLLNLTKNKEKDLSHEERIMNSSNVEESLEKLLKLNNLLPKDQVVERRFSEASLSLRRYSYSGIDRRESLNSVSSLGILDAAEMSTLSCESFEGVGGEGNHRDLGELVNEIEELQFQNKRISDENVRLKAQMSQSEDLYHQLIQENEGIKVKVNNLQLSLDKTRDLQFSHEELKTVLQTVEESRTNLKAKINVLEKENAILETSVKDLEEKLHFSNSAMEISKQRELSLLISHSDQKEYVNELCQKCNGLESQVKEYSLKCDEFELMIKELAEANESLRLDKKIADVQLAKAEEEITSLWETVNSCISGNEAPECDGQLQRNKHNYLSPVTSLVMRKFSDINCDRLCSSTPIGYKFYIQGLSLCAEMNNAITSGENLPTPFCGKHSISLTKNQSESPLLLYHSPPRKLHRLSLEQSKHKLYKSDGISSNSYNQDVAKKRVKAMDISCNDWNKTSATSTKLSHYVSCDIIDKKNDQSAVYAKVEDFENAKKSSQSYIYLNDKEKKATIQELSGLKSLIEAVCTELQADSKFIEKINGEAGDAPKIETDDQQMEKQQHKEGSDSVISDLSPSDVREQINMEIKALRAQIVRSHALLTYLQTKEKSPGRISKSIAQVTDQQNLSSDEEKPLFLDQHASVFQQGSFDDQVPSLYHNQFNRSNSSSTSHKSTPLHKSCLAQSCPILPSETSAVSRATQTEPLNGNVWESDEKKKGESSFSKSDVNDLVKSIQNESPILCNQTNDKRLIQMPCASELPQASAQFFLRVPNADHGTYLSGDESPHSPYFPRNRTYSFLTAIKKGNPNLVDANVGFGHNNNKHVLCYVPSISSNQPANAISHPYFGIPSSLESSCISHDLKAGSKEASDAIQENRRVSLAMDQIQCPDSSSISKKHDKVIQKKEVSIKENSALNMGDGKIKDDKASDKGFKMPQRNMRRGSGSGSPNSLSGIPRCPAFDFSEQDDMQSFQQSPQQESNTSGDIKLENLLGVNQVSEAASMDSRPKSPVQRLKDANQKKREANKNKSLMPDLMENSETESAKGSFECEAPELPLTVEVPPPPGADLAFPSLPDSFLRKLGVNKDSSTRSESFSEQEVESKFITLSLAFKTDKMTLGKRLELQKRQRDIAEKNVESEIKTLKDSLNSLNISCTSSEARDIISKMQNHVDIVQQSTSRMSGRAELYGSVQQEERISNAFEVLMLHVDNLKKLYDKEHRELEETRRILSDTKVLHNESGAGEGSVTESRKSLRSISLAVGSLKSHTVRRRASVSVFHQYSLPESSKNANLSWTSGSSSGSSFRVDQRSRLLNVLCPFTSTSSVGSSSISSSTHLPAPASPILSGISTKNSRRCSLPVSPARIPTARNITKISEVVADASSLISSSKQDISEESIYTKRALYSVNDQNEENNEDTSLETENSLAADVEDSSFHKASDKMEENVEVKELGDSSDEERDVFGHEAPDILRKQSLEEYGWSVLQYHWSRTSGLNLFKCTISVVLVVMAIFCLLISFLPCQASSSDTKTLHDVLEIILHPYVYPVYFNKPV